MHVWKNAQMTRTIMLMAAHMIIRLGLDKYVYWET